MTVVIDPERVEQAADQFALEVAPAVDAVLRALSGGLGGTESMAGDDEAGRSWSSSYDAATETVMGVGADVTNASYKLAGLLEMTWGNHARADAGSHPGGAYSSYLPRPMDYADNRVRPYDVPLSAGGFPGEPRGWSLIRSAVGYAWPSGHQDQLRAAGKSWGAAATAMSDASILVTPAVSALQEQQSPEIADAVMVSRAMQTHICDLSDAYTNLQNACDEYAGFLDRAHHDAGRELESLVRWTIGIESAGAFLTVVSAGLSEAGAQAAEAARIALTAGRVAGIIRDLISAAAGVCRTIGTAATRVLEISRKLKVLLGARLSRATTEAVAKLPDEAKTAEELAESRLSTALPNNRGLDASELKQTKTVAQHTREYTRQGRLARPYNDSGVTMQGIMDSASPRPDSDGIAGALEWLAPGSLNGSKGVWELVVDMRTKTVIHFLFTTTK